VDPGEALDRRPVEADPLRERALQLGRGDRDRLEEAEHIREPQSDKTDIPFLECAEHELFLSVHECLSSPGSGQPRRTVSPAIRPRSPPVCRPRVSSGLQKAPPVASAAGQGACSEPGSVRAGAEVVGVDYRFRPPTRRPEDNGAPPPRYRRDTADG